MDTNIKIDSGSIRSRTRSSGFGSNFVASSGNSSVNEHRSTIGKLY